MNVTVKKEPGGRFRLPRIRARFYLPVAGFVLLAVALAAGFTLRDPHFLPSAMINHPIGPFKLATLKDSTRIITNADLKGQVSLLNVWATWCPNCVIEHPEMIRISREENIRLIGVDYHDERGKAIAWLAARGDPYRFVIFDKEGKLGMNLGVYGAPETYLVDTDGVVRYRHIGIMTRQIFEQEFKPRLKLLRKR